ncbi:alpha-L-rhamnosidase [Flavivirga sp. 57AJ16]|uniref:alpha-L-rhamnosidase n=1 Tax=Flavivirga sp. 57AJ16 TaxID=3025307 RepID=UPI002366912C|nr:alpha-L-rhamnosidase [Flavivirga sp. 57AJ16]MDD7885131.1 family 78 glycoside hydrolase catalytic domain [Flavivirga sp. 57AJ16]
MFCFLILVNIVNCQNIKVDKILCENRVNPIGIDVTVPRFSWILSSRSRNVRQSAYYIQVSNNKERFESNTLWESGKVESELSVLLNYAGPKLSSNNKYYWRVKVWDQNGKPSKWSDVGLWQMGPIDISDWAAEWIQVNSENSIEHSSPIFRNEFKVLKKIESATANITSHGLYVAYINGHKIGDAYFTPGWTSYNKRLQYQTYDVTAMIQKGYNAIGAMLGSGWYSGNLVWEGHENFYGESLALLLQIKLNYTDGTSEIIGTNKNWKTTTGEVIDSEIYHGEIIDARKRKKGWYLVGYNDDNWEPVRVVNYSKKNLVATINEPIRKHEVFKPIEVITTPDGDKVLDFGQNLVGFVQVKIKGKSGDHIILKHAEVLDKNGNFYTENLRSAKQENKYILKGGEEEIFEPNFTWQGFRYVKVEGISGMINPEDFTAVALYSDMPKTGSFSTSNELINKLQHNIEWGQKGNFLDVPTDCPQRDERLGWTGDAQVFFNTAAFNMKVDNFFSKWMRDVEADQLENGSVPHVIPNVLGSNASGSAGWADVATIIPWSIYLNYGDKNILKQQYKSMEAWVDYISSQTEDYLWNKGSHFGDWLYYVPENNDNSAETDKFLIAQCFYANSVQIMIQTANLLKKQKDVGKYTVLLNKIKEAFAEKYITEDGKLTSDSQTAYVLALNFNMLPENIRELAAQRLADNIRGYNYHLTTGFLGTPYLCHVLTKFGYHDLAFTLLMQKTYPSWLYPVTMGATTIWERWDGQKPNGDFQTPSMNSFNHYAYGAIGDWMYKILGGINTSEKVNEVGYKKIILTPYINNNLLLKSDLKDQLTYVNADLNSCYGKISSHWKKSGDHIKINITIPVNTTAELHIPADTIEKVFEGKSKISDSKDIEIIGTTVSSVIVVVGSGTYNLIIKN